MPRRGGGGERGSSVIEVVVLVPVFVLVVLAVIQFALWYHASHVVATAAREGLRTARLEFGTAEAGRARARAFLAAQAPTLVEQPHITATREATDAAVAITGWVRPFVPGIHLTVTATKRGPTEPVGGVR